MHYQRENPGCFADAVKDKVMYEADVNMIGSKFIPLVSKSQSRQVNGTEASLTMQVLLIAC